MQCVFVCGPNKLLLQKIQLDSVSHLDFISLNMVLGIRGLKDMQSYVVAVHREVLSNQFET